MAIQPNGKIVAAGYCNKGAKNEFAAGRHQTAGSRGGAVGRGGDAPPAGRREMVVAALTSNSAGMLPGDQIVEHWKEAGLPMASIITGIVRTIKQDMVVRALGTLPSPDRKKFDKSLRGILSL